jgi:xylulokinase
MAYIIAYDFGTGGIKASLYDKDSSCVHSCFQAYETRFPQPGFHEQRPDDWWQAFINATKQLLHESSIDRTQVLSLGISGHSLGLVPLDAEGNSLLEWTPIWSDTRAGEEAKAFFEQYDEKQWYLDSGNGFPAAHYPLFKLKWLQAHSPDVFNKMVSFLGTKDYINFRLTGVIATDYSYASGCGGYHLDNWAYHDKVIDAAELPKAIFPKIVASTDIIGCLHKEAAEATGLPTTVKVVAGGVDNSCMALGAGNISDGNAYNSLGSSSWIAVSSKIPLVDLNSKPFVFTHVVPGLFTSATAIFSAGTALEWFRKEVFKGAEYSEITQSAQTSTVGANSLLFNPSLSGGSSLDRSPDCRGAFIGLALSHTKDDMAQAVFEGITLSLRTAYQALNELGCKSNHMRIVGGGSQNEYWMQMFADVFDCSISVTSVNQQCAALGAATLAAIGIGFWDDFSVVEKSHHDCVEFNPDERNANKYRQIHDEYKKISDDLCDISKRWKLITQ